MLARQELINMVSRFLEHLGISEERQEVPEQAIFEHSKNIDSRQKLLNRFFRVVCLEVGRGKLDRYRKLEVFQIIIGNQNNYRKTR